jgi:hypothetical protein
MSAYKIQIICKLLLKKRERKVAELCVQVKQQWQVEEVYTLPVTIYAIGIIPHIMHDVLKVTRLLRFAVCDPTNIGNLKYMQHTKLLGDITFQH